MARGDFDGERAVTACSEHVRFPFFIVEMFFVFWSFCLKHLE